VRGWGARFGLLFGLGVCMVLAAGVQSWGQNPRGTLRGEVSDVNGGRVASATVTAQSKGSGLTSTATSNANGEFRIEGLLPGKYEVTVAAKGFADAKADVDVVVSTVRDITVALKPAGVSESVNVQGKASSITTEPIDTASAVHQGAVSAHDLETIPLAARSVANIA